MNLQKSILSSAPRLARNVKRSFAFSLIELLVVIAIMALLMAMIVWGTSTAMAKAKRSRVQAEMLKVQTAIDSYKDKLGYYPPDHGTNDWSTPPLFYELTGAQVGDAAGGPWYTNRVTDPINKASIQKYFSRSGLQNSSPDANEVQNFLASGLNPKQYGEVSSNPVVRVLVVPVEGPPHNSGEPINPWRYRRNGPHNPGKYDLWAEIMVGGKTNIIGNWKE